MRPPTEDETQQIDTEGAVTEATLEEEPAVEDGEDEVDGEGAHRHPHPAPSQAQGEVRDARDQTPRPDETADDAERQRHRTTTRRK